MASAVDSRLAYARLSAVATASRLPTANRGSNNSYTTSWDTTWWRLWPKRSGGVDGLRTNGMLCVPLCYFGVFSALQALRNPRQTSSL